MYPDAIDRLHQENLRFLRVQRFIVPRKRNDNRLVEWKAERELIRRLEAQGYRVSLTTNNAPFDLFVDGATVEVKGSTWQKQGRYQAAIRNYEADVLILDCINGTHHWFIIPMAAITPRRSIDIYTYHVDKSKSQWRPYLDAWHYLDNAIDAKNLAWQLPLFKWGGSEVC